MDLPAGLAYQESRNVGQLRLFRKRRMHERKSQFDSGHLNVDDPLLSEESLALIEPTFQLERNERRAMSVAPKRTKSILDRCSLRLVPIMLIVTFGWQWAIAQAVVPGGQRIIHENWTFKDGAPFKRLYPNCPIR